MLAQGVNGANDFRGRDHDLNVLLSRSVYAWKISRLNACLTTSEGGQDAYFNHLKMWPQFECGQDQDRGSKLAPGIEGL